MNPITQNSEIFEATGLTITGLPEEYINNHPSNIVIYIEREHRFYSKRPDEVVTYDVEFKFPALSSGKRKTSGVDATGYFNINLKNHPENRGLLEIIKVLDRRCVELDCYGRQFDKQFYVRAFCPMKDKDFTQGAFFYFLEELGIRYEFPSSITVRGSPEEAAEHYKLYYCMFRDRYPKELQTWIDEHIDDRSYSDSVYSFVKMDWRPPKLELPAAKEAKRILDQLVYGMEEVKERLLEFLEEVRRSGTIAKNLMLTGPAGVGKTTILQALALMTGNLPMSVVPMSNCNDIETFVGFGRTYMHSQEGLLTTALMSPTRPRPDGTQETVHQISQVLFLNELDKSAAAVQNSVLRMLDDNRSFFDVYHQATIDLSHVMVVADANDVSKIQKPLLDRFDVIQVPPYTEEEKAVIFRRYVFPKALKKAHVERTEVSVTKEAVALIASRIQTPGVRELNTISRRIIGNYLLHHSWRKSTVHYTPEMVERFLPKVELRNVSFVSQPGSIRSAVVCGSIARAVTVQCLLAHASDTKISVYGTTDPFLQQEIEAAACCALHYLPSGGYDVKLQLFGLQADAPCHGQLGFPAFIAVMSTFYNRIAEGVFFGNTTILGGMSCVNCDDPDAVMAYADHCGEEWVYTATGFSERLKGSHNASAIELLDAGVALSLLFGASGL